MTELNQVYRCAVCGNITEVLHAGGGELVCCGKPMVLQKENSVDASKEKHVPVIERDGSRVTVKVGSIDHPMEEKHFIEWIEVVSGDRVYRKYLTPGEKPQAEFEVPGVSVLVRGYCNLHGLWISRG